MKFDSTGYNPSPNRVQSRTQQGTVDTLSLVRSLGLAFNHSAGRPGMEADTKNTAIARPVEPRVRY
ncbi:MAG: hypothetical protein P1V20_03920 [Verrucomicrobiales bacterium]|nr:hypothetical protein [Verrucomicrobiales bacterium]